METLPLKDACKQLPEISRRMSQDEGSDVYTITDEGRPTLVVMSFEQWQSLEETIEIQSDEELMSALRRSALDVAEGRVISEEEADELLGW